MVQITVDTERDSTATLQRLLRFLEEELQGRGHNPLPSRPQPEPLRVDDSNPFGSMFGSDSSSSSGDMFAPKETASSQPTSTPDMFAAFNHETPSPSTSSSSFLSADSINQNMQSTPASTPSASQLLDEDDVEDTTDHLHYTESLAEEILQKGSTRKPEMPYNLEPYD